MKLERPDQTLTYTELVETISRVQANLAARGFKCSPSSSLGSSFSRAQKLTKHSEEVPQNFMTLATAHEALQIAQAVELVLDKPGAEELIHRVTKSDMRLMMRVPSSGKDALWELDLHAHMVGHRADVHFSEPDLVVQLPQFLGRYGLACKKVYSIKSVEKQLQKGYRQLSDSGLPGVIAFNINELTPQQSVLKQPTREAAMEVLYRGNNEFLRRNHSKFVAAVLGGRCDGILVATTVLADVQNLTPNIVTMHAYSLWRLHEASPAAYTRFTALGELVGAETA